MSTEKLIVYKIDTFGTLDKKKYIAGKFNGSTYFFGSWNWSENRSNALKFDTYQDAQDAIDQHRQTKEEDCFIELL